MGQSSTRPALPQSCCRRGRCSSYLPGAQSCSQEKWLQFCGTYSTCTKAYTAKTAKAHGVGDRSRALREDVLLIKFVIGIDKAASHSDWQILKVNKTTINPYLNFCSTDWYKGCVSLCWWMVFRGTLRDTGPAINPCQPNNQKRLIQFQCYLYLSQYPHL